jgi:hypothetical protein
MYLVKGINKNKKRHMKKIILAFIPLLFIALVSCKKMRNESATVVRDCTGTYLRINEKDYQVCNPEKVAAYSDGTTVTARFKKIKECNGSARDGITCKMFHQNEGWVEVEKVK